MNIRQSLQVEILAKAPVMRQTILLTYFVMLLWGLCFGNAVTIAQDDSQPVDSESKETGVPVAQQVGSAPSKDRIIYIPFKDLDGSFQDANSNIVLPYAEYQELLKVWKSRTENSSPPAAVMTSADYKVRIDGDLARISATLKLTILGKPWVWFRVKFGEASISQVTGDDVLLRGVGAGEYELLFATPGEKTVQLELAVPVSQSPEGRQFALNVPPVGVATLDVEVPKKDQAIIVTPRIVELPLPPEDAPGDVTRLRANIGATKELRVQWHPQTTLKPEMNLLASVNNETLVNLEDGLIHTDTWLHYEILRGSMEQCRVVVPVGHRILDVTASVRIKDWKAVEQDGNQVVTIDLLSPAEKGVTVEVHSEHKLNEAGQFQVSGRAATGSAQGIHALDVVRESGQLAVRYSADYNVTILGQRGVVRIEEAEVAQRLKGGNRLTFKFYTPDMALELSAKPVEARLMVGHQIQFTFQDNELQVANSLQYTVERAGVFELKLRVPENLIIDDVQSPKMKEYNFDEQSRELTVTLTERTQGAIPLNIRAHRLFGAEEASQNLPLIEPLNAVRETGAIYVYAKEAVEVITDQQGLEGVQPLPANQANRGTVALNSAWSFTRRPVTIPVRTKRKPTRLSAQIGTTVDIRPELTQVQTQLNYLIEYSGVDTFRFEVPEVVSEGLRIEIGPEDQESAPIKQRTASPAVDGWVTWTVVTQREVLGRQRLLVTYDTANSGLSNATEEAAAGNNAATPAAEDLLSIQLIRPLGLVDADGNVSTGITNIQGEVVVQKERSLSITANATGGGMEPIDLRELKTLPQSGTLAYRYFNASAEDRATLNIVQSRHEIQEVVSTVVSRGLVEIVAGEDSEATYRTRFNIKTTERQRLLVHLPVNLEVLGTYLNDREIKLEKAELLDSDKFGPNWSPFWVNVARTESSEEAFLLTFQFLWRVNPPLGESSFGRGRMSLPLPVIGNGESSVAQELKVVVWVPEKYSLVGSPKNFDLQTQSRSGAIFLGERANRQTDQLHNWVIQNAPSVSGQTQFPTEGRVPYVYSNLGGASLIKVKWWNKILMTIIVSVAIGLIAWVLLRTSWENKLGMLLIAVFIATLYGLVDSHALSQGVYAARFGLMLLVGLWVIHGVFNLARLAQGTIVATSGVGTALVSSPVVGTTDPSPKPDSPSTSTPENSDDVGDSSDS